MMRPTNFNNNNSQSTTIIVQNPFDNPSNPVKYHHDISIPTTSTSLIPIPSSLSTNSIINQPTMIGTYPPTRMYLNNSHIGKIRPSNGITPRMLLYPTQSQVIMPQQSPMIYNPHVLYRPNGHYISNNTSLQSLLQANSQISDAIPVVSKVRKKRKTNESEDDPPTKSCKRKKKGIEDTNKYVESSLQQIRDLPMLTPIEPLLDITNEMSTTKKSPFQGEFGNLSIETINDYYRPYRQASLTCSTLERHYRLCTNFLHQSPDLPSPPLLINSSEKSSELLKEQNLIHNEDSIISTSTDDDDDDEINDIQQENSHLLKALSSSSNNNLRPLSPILTKTENKHHQVDKNEKSDKVSVTLTLTTEAANKVQNVIAAISDLLKIPCPSTLDVHQTLAKPTNDILSLTSNSQVSNISVYKIGRETNVSIQSLIDTQPKICRYCSKDLITENFLKKSLNELPTNLRDSTLTSEPFIYFCNEQCFNNYQQRIITTNFLPLLCLKRREENLNEIKKRMKRWNPDLLPKTIIQSSDTEINLPLSINSTQDKRICVFCNGIGDMESTGPGRLLNLDIGQWCHLNCALWSSEVYETVSGALMGVNQAFKRSINTECVICKKKGSSLSCFFQRCINTYHYTCAVENGCVFYKNKTIMCPSHALKTINDDEILEDRSVLRKIWIDRDEIKQIQNYMNDEHDDKSYILRIGSLILHNIGQLLPHQLQSSNFHNRNFIYPVGYTITRFYWSMTKPNHRCEYQCSIIDIDNKPMFRIRVEENEQIEEFIESTAKDVWKKILIKINLLRRKYDLVKMFPEYVKGEDLFGLTEPHIIRLIESLPGVEILQNYAFKYGRLQLFDMPLTVNPTGCARSEPKLQTHFRRHAQTITSSHSTRSALPRSLLGGVETNQVPYVKQFVLSKSTQYRKLKIEWRQNTYLAKSRIQGLGLFAARDLEKHTMVIEYIGELIRNEVANNREKLYEAQNRGIYMFRLDDDYVIDATVSGCLARYINHSCEPNALTEVVQIDKDNKIVIITNRRVAKGEELMYDYKFDFEEDSKIPCLCGALNCRKWMN